MIQVSPQIKLNDFERAGRRFSAVRVCLTGMRWVAEYRSADGVVLWKDVPASHGLYAPCVYDPASGVTHAAPGLEWWSGPMGRIFKEPPVVGSGLEIRRHRKVDSAVVLNTVDSVFGHSLLLLLNATYYLDRFPEHGLIVVATPELRRYIPEGVAEEWILNCAPGGAERWHKCLADHFAARCGEGRVFIAAAPSHPDPSRYDLRRHGIVPAAGAVNHRAPRILFVYRGTRLWGGSWKSERQRLARLGGWLRRLWPEVRLEIFGHAALPEGVEGWSDCTRRGRGDYDEVLLRALVEADLVIGAHGSSQLLPSAVARLVLQLVPLDKQPSLLQDFLFDEAAANVRQHVWRRRFIYGNSTLNDIGPRQVAQLANAMISMQGQFDFYQSTAGSDPLRDAASIESAYAGEIAPAAIAWHERLRASLDLDWQGRFWQLLRKLGAERD